MLSVMLVASCFCFLYSLFHFICSFGVLMVISSYYLVLVVCSVSSVVLAPVLFHLYCCSVFSVVFGSQIDCLCSAGSQLFGFICSDCSRSCFLCSVNSLFCLLCSVGSCVSYTALVVSSVFTVLLIILFHL